MILVGPYIYIGYSKKNIILLFYRFVSGTTENWRNLLVYWILIYKVYTIMFYIENISTYVITTGKMTI